MNLREAAQDYRDPVSRLITPQLRPTPSASGNAILYESIYTLTLVLRGEARTEDYDHFIRVMGPCFDVPGLIDRDPTEFKEHDQNSFDDYTGLVTASKYMRAPYAKQVLDYGRSSGKTYLTKYVYNNDVHGKWTKHAWLGRQPQFVAHLNYAADEVPCWALRKYFSFNLNVSSMKDPSGVIQAWMRARAYPVGADDGCDMAVDSWRLRMLKQWGSMAAVIGAHLKNPEHPLAKYGVAY